MLQCIDPYADSLERERPITESAIPVGRVRWGAASWQLEVAEKVLTALYVVWLIRLITLPARVAEVAPAPTQRPGARAVPTAGKFEGGTGGAAWVPSAVSGAAICRRSPLLAGR